MATEYEFTNMTGTETTERPGLMRRMFSREEPVVHHVKVTDIDIPFTRIVSIMVLWAIAAIPASIILAILGAVFWIGILGAITAP